MPLSPGVDNCNGGDTGTDPIDGGLPGGEEPEPDQPTPCNTQNQLIDAQSTQALFAELWRLSNPTAVDQMQRSEQAAFLTRASDGTYASQRFPASWYTDPCTLDIPLGTVPPAGTVAIVHTHPWHIGEQQTTCGQVELPFGFSGYVNYNGMFSEPDQQVLAEFEQVLGYELKGYILDFEGIKEFTDTSATVDVLYGRCAY